MIWIKVLCSDKDNTGFGTCEDQVDADLCEQLERIAEAVHVPPHKLVESALVQILVDYQVQLASIRMRDTAKP